MASTVPFKLITPRRIVFEGDASLVIAVTTEGEEGILPQHALFWRLPQAGRVARERGRGRRRRRGPKWRPARALHAALPGPRVTVLVDEALHFDDIDVARTREDLTRATERQRSAGSDRLAFAREQSAIDFANAKLRLTGHH